jgi:hypothetical protein
LGLGVSLQLIHIYVTPLKRALQVRYCDGSRIRPGSQTSSATYCNRGAPCHAVSVASSGAKARGRPDRVSMQIRVSFCWMLLPLSGLRLLLLLSAGRNPCCDWPAAVAVAAAPQRCHLPLDRAFDGTGRNCDCFSGLVGAGHRRYAVRHHDSGTPWRCA